MRIKKNTSGLESCWWNEETETEKNDRLRACKRTSAENDRKEYKSAETPKSGRKNESGLHGRQHG